MERVTRQVTTVGASRTLDFAYDKPGNLTSKLSNVGADLGVTVYTYGTAGKPHRLTTVTIGGVSNKLGYDANGNVVDYQKTGDWTWLDYDGRNNVTRITVGASKETATPTARNEFWYTPDGERYLGRESWDDAAIQRTHFWIESGSPRLGFGIRQIPTAVDDPNDIDPPLLYDPIEVAVALKDHLGHVTVVGIGHTAASVRKPLEPIGDAEDLLDEVVGVGGSVAADELENRVEIVQGGGRSS